MRITEDEIKERFITAFNSLLMVRDEVIANCHLAIEALCDCSAIDAELAEKSGEVEILTEMTRKHIEENASLARDQTGYQERYNDLLSRYNAATERIAELTEIIEKRKSQKTVLTAFAEAMERQSQVIEEFGEELWLATVEKATVFSDSRIVFTFINSTETEA